MLIFFITKLKSFILHNICTLYGSLFYIYFRSATPLCNNLIDLSDMIFRNLRSTDFQLLLLQLKTENHLHLNQCHLEGMFGHLLVVDQVGRNLVEISGLLSYEKIPTEIKNVKPLVNNVFSIQIITIYFKF